MKLNQFDYDGANVFKSALSYFIHHTNYRKRYTDFLLRFLCSIAFLRLIWSRFPNWCIQGPFPISRLYFYGWVECSSLLSIRFWTYHLTFPIDLMRLHITWRLIGHNLLLTNRLPIVRCLLFIVVSTVVTIIAWSSSTRLQEVV